MLAVPIQSFITANIIFFFLFSFLLTRDSFPLMRLQAHVFTLGPMDGQYVDGRSNDR